MRKLTTLFMATALFALGACPAEEAPPPPVQEQPAPKPKPVEKPLPEPTSAEEKQAAGEFTKENVSEKATAFEAELDKDIEAARALGAAE